MEYYIHQTWCTDFCQFALVSFIMAQETCSSSSSPSSSNQTWIYNVFVSFRGEDTRYRFTVATLDQSGIHSFEDNRKLERGKDIWTELEKAIQISGLRLQACPGGTRKMMKIGNSFSRSIYSY